jgi:hypothetical protein
MVLSHPASPGEHREGKGGQTCLAVFFVAVFAEKRQARPQARPAADNSTMAWRMPRIWFSFSDAAHTEIGWGVNQTKEKRRIPKAIGLSY